MSMDHSPTYEDFKRGLASGQLQSVDIDVLHAFQEADGHSLTATNGS